MNGIRRFSCLAALFCCFVLKSAPGAPAAAAEPLRLIVDYNDGAQLHFRGLPVKEKATAVDLLRAAETHPHGVKSVVRGSGQTALVTSIGGQKNEGGGRTAKNWLYYINDKRADVGAGVYELRPGDVIMWKFDTLREEP
jgi:hypothetical protein